MGEVWFEPSASSLVTLGGANWAVRPWASSTFYSNLVITWKGLRWKMLSYSTRAKCTLVLIHLLKPRYSTVFTIALWLVILVTLSPCTKPSRISIGKGWKSSSRCISRNVRSVNVKNWNFSPWWTKSKNIF